MPLVTAANVFSGARAYLNDNAGALYTDVILLPYLIEAYEYGRNEQALRNLPNSYKTDEQTIAAGAVTYTTLPTDLLLPIKLEERAVGDAASLRTLMVQTTWDPSIAQTENLIYWDWRNQEINFLGALTDRVVTLSYLGDMDPTGVTTGSTDLLGNVRSFLAAKVAALVHEFVNQNPSLAQSANAVAEEQLRKIIDVQVKARQALPGRFRPHVAYPRYGRFS